MKKIALAAALVLLASSLGADAPYVYAITGARIVTAAGAPIENGTIVFRDGIIDQIGAGLAPPPSARVYDGKGLTVYPGLIDMGNTSAVTAKVPEQPSGARTTEEVERWKRDALLRPHVRAAEHLAVDSTAMRRLGAAGVTSVLAVPGGHVFSGQSALVNVLLPENDPQVGALADVRKTQPVVRTPVAVHVALPGNPPGDAYPNSLMGVIAFVRQTLLDAQHYGQAQAYASRARRGARPPFDPALEALQPVVAGRLPVVYRADTLREIDRALDMSKAFALDVVLAGAREADQSLTALKSRNIRVIYDLHYPERLKSLAPDADEPLRELRARAHAPAVPAALDRAGILFAFESGGIEDPKDFVKNAAKAVKAGLPPEAAIRALTINAATIAGAADRLGSLEKGKLANLIVTDGDLFAEKTTITHVFIDGRPVRTDVPTERRRTAPRWTVH